ncbi:CerR family C-terminal domain-containing protein [Sphingobium nicotianae]|uniref:CerR family C-terminal domain-containing protein n=1 Tax=Sphingobium nicotianae TaxID=2782607 RepID=A0A9X1DAR7_9SPHN|nr:CerR family C-terminal domain-containing protein [Sphingobium nicotianae]MBT2186499.1 CerR family C-terminal domain-containing protein [Sphingobium nicotianae]
MATQDLSQRIIEAALDQFGRLGFDAASTRDIARASGTAMSSITYHFGGKQGLYLACADHIAVAIGKVHAPLMDAIKANPPHTVEAARAGALALLENFARFMLAPDSETYCQFIVREQQHPTEAFERLYAHMMQPVLETATVLLGIARPALAEPVRRALVTNLLGMAIVLRVGRACVARVMQVDDIDAETAELLITTLRGSAQTLLTED